MPQSTCLDCERPLPPSVARSGNRRCERCAKAWRATARCVTCDADLSKRRAQKYCSKRCCDIDRGQVRPELLPVAVCALVECAAEFQPMQPGQRTCCEPHAKKLWNREHPEPWNDRRRDNYHRRRALKAGSSAGLRVDLSQIRERDGNVCHLCCESVPDAAWPDPLSPSLDHVVPLSKGGAHDPANVKLAHLRCNVEKGAELLEA